MPIHGANLRRIPQSRFFKEPEWLGFRHDGHDVVQLNRYITIREEGRLSDTGDGVDERARGLAASTQSMLTFGLLEAVIEERVPEDMLVRTDESGRRVLMTARLVEIVQGWVDKIGRTGPEVQGQWLKRVHTNLRIAHSLMMTFTRRSFEIFRPLGDDAPAMVLLIALIGETLVNGKMCFMPRLPQSGFSWSMVWIPEYRDGLSKEMVECGWCPFTVESLVSTFTVACLNYAMDRGPLQGKNDHQGCSQTSCTTYNVDVDNYIPSHAATCMQPGETCEYSKPPLYQVVQHISQGHIPVVTFVDRDDGSSAGLEVHSSSDIPYIAISHVWADGLGSTTEVGLPTCQLRRLDSLVSKLRPGAAFWVDSVCIPKEPEARKKAIKMMARTYQDADAVLVLDSGLQLCKPAESNCVKILRVLTSSWMHRLWTLQEAVLAKKLNFLFANDTRVGWEDLNPDPDNMLRFPHLTGLAMELFRLTKQSRYGEYTIGDAARSLRWRSTSRKSDETLAIASLLGVQPAALVDLRPEDRMVRLIQDVGKIPRNALFLIGPKLEAFGYRWAPVSFMAAQGGSRGGVQMSTHAADAVSTPFGLQASYASLVFPKITAKAGQSWKVRDEKTGWVYVIGDSSSVGGSYLCDMVLLLETIPVGSASACVGVLKCARPVDGDGDESVTEFCEYKRRLIIFNYGDKEYQGQALASGILKIMRVCVG